MEVLFQKGRYALIDRGIEYVVACGFDGKEWSQGYYYTHSNTYSVGDAIEKAKCLNSATDHFLSLVDGSHISRNRLEKLATKFKDGLLECDSSYAMEFFEGECDLMCREEVWLGIDTSKYSSNCCPSSTCGDYSPSNPWDAPGMSTRDFIGGL